MDNINVMDKLHSVKTRAGRMLGIQKERLVRLLNNASDITWYEIADELNQIGPSKTPDEWKCSFNFMKTRVRNKIYKCGLEYDQMTEIEKTIFNLSQKTWTMNGTGQENEQPTNAVMLPDEIPSRSEIRSEISSEVYIELPSVALPSDHIRPTTAVMLPDEIPSVSEIRSEIPADIHIEIPSVAIPSDPVRENFMEESCETEDVYVNFIDEPCETEESLQVHRGATQRTATITHSETARGTRCHVRGRGRARNSTRGSRGRARGARVRARGAQFARDDEALQTCISASGDTLTDVVLGIQKDRLLFLVKAHFFQVIGRYTGTDGAKLKERRWIRIVDELNLLGPSRTVKEWKTIYSYMKSSAKAKLSAIRQRIRPVDDLSEYDKTILSMYGIDLMDGQQNLGEGGFAYDKTLPFRNAINTMPQPSHNVERSMSGNGIRINGMQDETGRETSVHISEYEFNSDDEEDQLGENGTETNMGSKLIKCDLCGSFNGSIRCQLCNNKMLCEKCDDTYHRHPLRQHHMRKTVSRQHTVTSTIVRPATSQQKSTSVDHDVVDLTPSIIIYTAPSPSNTFVRPSSASTAPSPSPSNTFVRPSSASTAPSPSPSNTFVRPSSASTAPSPSPSNTFVRPSSASTAPSPSPSNTFVRPSSASTAPSPSPSNNFVRPLSERTVYTPSRSTTFVRPSVNLSSGNYEYSNSQNSISRIIRNTDEPRFRNRLTSYQMVESSLNAQHQFMSDTNNYHSEMIGVFTASLNAFTTVMEEFIKKSSNNAST